MRADRPAAVRARRRSGARSGPGRSSAVGGAVPAAAGPAGTVRSGNAARPRGPREPGARRRNAPAAEKCELCATEVPDEHGHIADLEAASLLCACRACYLLFTRPVAGRKKYVAVPDRYLADPGRVMSPAEWDQLEIPVGLAFFLRSSREDGELAGFYPSPAGVTECQLDLQRWAQLVASYPLLGAPAPDVEAALISRSDSGVEYFLVPIDACYELAGRMRLHWRGFDGGTEARESIAAFLDGVRRAAARPVQPGGLRWLNSSLTAPAHARTSLPWCRRCSSRCGSARRSGQRVEAIALRCQIRIEPARRRYADDEAERLNDLFGETQRWADTLKPLQFTNVSIMVPGFTGSTDDRPAGPAHLRHGDRRDPVLRRARRRRGSAAAAVQRDGLQHCGRQRCR